MTEKQPYIILSDADFDDLIAIAWLSICPEADIKLISCSQDDWSHSPQGAENIARVLYQSHLKTPE